MQIPKINSSFFKEPNIAGGPEIEEREVPLSTLVGATVEISPVVTRATSTKDSLVGFECSRFREFSSSSSLLMLVERVD